MRPFFWVKLFVGATEVALFLVFVAVWALVWTLLQRLKYLSL